MFNVTILKMRDIIKYLIGTILTIFLVIYIIRCFSNIKSNKMQSINKLKLQFSLTSCLDKELPTATYKNEEYNKVENKNQHIETGGYLESFLKTQISAIKGMEEIEQISENETNKSENDNSENNDNKEITLASTSNIATEVVTPNPIAESYNVQYENVKIKNQTSYTLTEDMLNPNITIDNKNILIFHTHSCESYTPSEQFPYTQTGNFRTTDLNYTVTRVGSELENYLKQYNINVVHNTSYHDYPAYNGSYTRSLETVENLLTTTPADIIIDLHRDAIGSRPDYAPTVKIGEDYAAQIMFVIGTNEGGLWHPNWNQNLKFAIKFQKKAEEMYPGLFKPIMLTTSRYNQHTGKCANIIEVGSTGNTLEQCINSMKYFSAVMNEVLSE